ncbi:cysteine-rich RECEPTOR-like kinase [Rhynchospora pubera]|uniref:non-specific serine/threonine protein kinase n=1 Tax=Rhynchospora pubera TaxID=906938 RepID=A0AAV8BR36_9POAL|nr:cysteine-rich RECEPTOR-like kinase [Rhynchospora pubera]
MQSITLFVFSFILTSFVCLHSTKAFDPLYVTCGSTGNYTANSTYCTNLEHLFSALSTEAVTIEGFSKNITGTGSDQIFGLVLCQGDVSSTVCGQCLNQSFKDVATMCPYSKEAVIWYDMCLLRYSNRYFLDSTDNAQQIIIYNTQSTGGGRFSGWESSNSAHKSYIITVVNTLLSNVSDQAAYNSTKRFGTGDITIPPTVPVLYGLSQCTPDMSNDTCRECLQDLIDHMLNYFDGRTGGRILGVRCTLRYDMYAFFSGDPDVLLGSTSAPGTPAPAISANVPTASPNSTRTPSGTNKGARNRHLTIIVSSTLAFLLAGCFIGFLWIEKLRYADLDMKISQEERMLSSNEPSSLMSRQSSSEFPFFDFYEIAKATDNFSLDNKLGQGGFGPVYKGVFPEGLEIAVKRLSAQSCQGIVEFQNEIQLIAKLQHRNLVRLLGWCIQGEENLLVYEFMPNKSLDFFIFDIARGALLNWGKRFHIIEDIAQGLLYLHKHSRLRIVHRDLKASNVLLDSEMNPKISDFGLARIFDPKELQAITSRVIGTYGYMAPEYASEGLFSIKSDVFSYGVLLVEIVSGKRSLGFHQHGVAHNLLGYAYDRWKEGKVYELVSPVLTDAQQEQVNRCIHVALLCVQENPVDRPIMSDVIAYLSSTSLVLPEPNQPAYFNVRVNSRTSFTDISTDFEASSRSVNYVTTTDPQGR